MDEGGGEKVMMKRRIFNESQRDTASFRDRIFSSDLQQGI
jgi:hypothetical protein